MGAQGARGLPGDGATHRRARIRSATGAVAGVRRGWGWLALALAVAAVVVVRSLTHGSSAATTLPKDPEARAASAMLAAIGSLPPGRPPALPRGAPLARLSRHVAALPRA